MNLTTEQLAQMIQSLSIMATAIQQNQQQANQAPPQVNNVTLLPPFETFDSVRESFKSYKERFENYLQIKNIKNDHSMCAKILLNSVGSTIYNLVSSLAAPKTPTDLQYNELLDLLEKHLCPKKNVIVEQHRFLSEFQNENESIADYVAKLRKHILDCEFKCECGKSIANTFLRAQFVRGIREQNIREHLLQDNNLEFQEIVDRALALEASKLNSRELSNAKLQEINRISKHSSKNNWKHTNKFSNNQDRNRRQSKSRINYRELGIENTCIRCGRDNHISKDCRVDRNKLKCHSCKKTGHIEKVCIQTLLAKRSNKEIKAIEENEQTSYDDVNTISELHGINMIIDIFKKSNTSGEDIEKYFANILIEGKCQRFEVDSGAGFTLLPEEDFKRLNLKAKLQKTNIRFRSYTAGIFNPLGVIEVPVQYKDSKSKEIMFIVSSKFSPLLGRAWIRHLHINLAELDNQKEKLWVPQINSIDPVPAIIEKFSDIFVPEIRCIPNLTCSLKLRENAKPLFIKNREVPYSLREKVEKELDELEKNGIITKVNTSDWGSPLVVIPKPDGNVRLCVDYKIAVNPQLKSAHYPIRRIDDILNNLRNSTHFCRLDIYKAYLHVKVDDESKAIQTISTHRGTYQMNRLSFGIKTAPSEFNRIMDHSSSSQTALFRNPATKIQVIPHHEEDVPVLGPEIPVLRRSQRQRRPPDYLQYFV